MPYVNHSRPSDDDNYQQATFPLRGEGNQLLIINYPTHVGIDILHHSQVLSTTSSEYFKYVQPGYGASIRIGPTFFVLPRPALNQAIDWLNKQGVYQNPGANSC